MTFARSFSIIAAISVSSLVASAWAATDEQHDTHHPAATTATQVAQASSGNAMMGSGGMSTMPGYSEQMKAMQAMHDKMMAAKTPEERNALMAEQMKLMQNGMGMMGQMGQMGQGAMSGKPGDMAARQGMMDRRMDMMQSMMQMMMDRMPPAPAAK
jgi:hypothetical protein